jgi:hypothetical protein
MRISFKSKSNVPKFVVTFAVNGLNTRLLRVLISLGGIFSGFDGRFHQCLPLALNADWYCDILKHVQMCERFYLLRFNYIHPVLVARYYPCTLAFTANSSVLLCRDVLYHLPTILSNDSFGRFFRLIWISCNQS